MKYIGIQDLVDVARKPLESRRRHHPEHFDEKRLRNPIKEEVHLNVRYLKRQLKGLKGGILYRRGLGPPRRRKKQTLLLLLHALLCGNCIISLFLPNFGWSKNKL